MVGTNKHYEPDKEPIDELEVVEEDVLDMHKLTCAANLINSLLRFRRMIQKEEVNQLMIEGVVPLDSWQYVRTFDTTRIPGVETDTIRHYPNSSTHVVVLYKDRYYKVPTHSKGRLLNPKELEMQMERILNDTSSPVRGEEILAALTAGERRAWAEVRSDFFSRGVNRISLETIERSAFFVALDDVEYLYDPNDPSQLDHYAKWMLHGNGRNRWYDKSFCMIVMKNGKVGLNVEHSWADAPVMGHCWEWALFEEMGPLGYNEDGHTRGVIETIPIAPQRLQFEFPAECLKRMEVSYNVAKALCDDVDLVILMFTDFGKGFIKKCKISPDGFLQMVLQLAYRRDAGHFCLTYEASMTRLFREGRTETVRSCTVESADFVNAMLNPEASNAERRRLLQVACDYHQTGYLNSMSGKGIDRHLFCLYVVSRYLEIDTPFLKEVLSEPWKLSTSQTPQNQTGCVNLAKNPEHIASGGGFGPVADDGYGVSYIIAGEDAVFFHISSKRSSPATDSNRFREQIRQAMLDVKAIFDD